MGENNCFSEITVQRIKEETASFVNDAIWHMYFNIFLENFLQVINHKCRFELLS